MQRSAETISPKITTIRSRILIPVCGIFVGFVILLGILHIFEQRQASVLAKHDCAEKSLFFSKIIILHSSNLEALDDTNSYWDDLVTFAKKPNMAWAKRNLDSIISPSSVDGLFVYNSSSKLIYATNTDD
jgi:sensor domain CHASE-containing protein